LQGNRAGVVGCGFWNSGCGGLDLTLVWQIIYGIIAGLVIVVFPFFIFYYEADDEGMEADAASPESCMGRCMDFRNCKRSFLSALCYTSVTVAISLIVWLVSYNYLANTYLPYKLTAVDVGSVAFAPVGTPIEVLPTGASPNACPLIPGGIPGQVRVGARTRAAGRGRAGVKAGASASYAPRRRLTSSAVCPRLPAALSLCVPAGVPAALRRRHVQPAVADDGHEDDAAGVPGG
jgi:hypothetical protein